MALLSASRRAISTLSRCPLAHSIARATRRTRATTRLTAGIVLGMACQKRKINSLRPNWQGPLGMSSATALAGMTAPPLRSALLRGDRKEDGGLLLHVLALAVRALDLARLVLAQRH